VETPDTKHASNPSLGFKMTTSNQIIAELILK
jgi:hypothetical protein